MRNKFYLTLIVALINSVFGAPTYAKDTPPAKENPFTAWSQCPKNIEELDRAIQKLTNNDAHFENLSSKEKMQIIYGNDWQAIYLRHIGSYLLPSNMQSEFAKSCWMYFKETQAAVSAKNKKLAQKNNSDWLDCLKVKYSPVPVELERISNCIKNL